MAFRVGRVLVGVVGVAATHVVHDADVVVRDDPYALVAAHCRRCRPNPVCVVDVCVKKTHRVCGDVCVMLMVEKVVMREA